MRQPLTTLSTKILRFAFEKFPQADTTLALATQLKRAGSQQIGKASIA
jgi:carbamoylphosphate synthase large subunit